MARLMALDVGSVRIGVALSDARGVLASPETTLHVSRNEEQTFAAIQRLIGETEVEGLVIGLPISLDGQLHTQGERVQAFAERLRQHITIPLTYWDERLSTVEAKRLLTKRDYEDNETAPRHGSRARQRNTQRKRRHKGQEIDALAATVILQDYLDTQGSETKERQS